MWLISCWGFFLFCFVLFVFLRQFSLALNSLCSQVGLEFTGMVMPQPPECWDDRGVLLLLAQFNLSQFRINSFPRFPTSPLSPELSLTRRRPCAGFLAKVDGRHISLLLQGVHTACPVASFQQNKKSLAVLYPSVTFWCHGTISVLCIEAEIQDFHSRIRL